MMYALINKAEIPSANTPLFEQGVVEFLNTMLPLMNACHSEVDEYTVEIPTRYAKCFAILNDGRKVGFRNCRQFAGWSGWEAGRCYLFHSDDVVIQIQTDPKDAIGRLSPGKISEILIDSDDEIPQRGRARPASFVRKFIAPDGSQVHWPSID